MHTYEPLTKFYRISHLRKIADDIEPGTILPIIGKLDKINDMYITVEGYQIRITDTQKYVISYNSTPGKTCIFHIIRQKNETGQHMWNLLYIKSVYKVNDVTIFYS